MTQPTQPTQITPTGSEHRLKKSARVWAGALCLWRLCGNARCRRARACRGNVDVCFPSNFPLLPEGVQDWFYGVGEAKAAKLSFDEAMEWLDGTPAGEAFHDWWEAVRESLRAQKPR